MADSELPQTSDVPPSQDPVAAAPISAPGVTSPVAPLAEFRRKAGPIVAQARGLTPAARLKLADIARQLGIPEDQFDAALRSLIAPDAKTAAHSKSADKFRRRLLKDLQASAGAILGPTHEARIIAAAREKYGLDEATALEMLASATAELGIQRVRGDEAVRNLTDAVQDAIGDHTWIAEEVRLRLHAVGKQWGLGEETVNRYIQEQLEANQALAARSVQLSRAIYATVGVLAVFVVVTLGVLFSRRKDPPPTTPGTLAATTTQEQKADEPAGPPKWWNVDLALAVDRAGKEVDEFATVAPDLASPDEARRAAGYAALVSLVERVPPDPKQLATVGVVLQNAYATEPSDTAAAAIREKLLSHLPGADSPLPKHTAAYDLAYWAAETAVDSAMNAKAPPERRTPMIDSLAIHSGVRIDPNSPHAEQTDRILAGLSRAALQHLTSHAETSPASVAALHSAVSERAARFLDAAELQRLQAQLLLATLPAATESGGPRSDAAQFRTLLLELAASTDPQVTIALVDLYERMQPSPLRDELQSLLLLRLNVSNAPQNPRAIARALRRALGVAPSGSQAVEQRWELLRSRAAEALERAPGGPDQATRQLTDAAEFAWLATQALALAQGEAGLPIYDELVALYPEEPFVLKIEEGGDAPLPTPLASGGGLGPQENQALVRFLGFLTNSGTNQVQRESSLRGLTQLAPKLDDLTLTQARQLAGYLLQNKPENEHAESISAAGTLRRWKQLKLAVADLIGSATLPPDQLSALIEALANRSLVSAESNTYRRALLESVASDLPQSAAAANSIRADHRQALDAAATSLSETYRIRARLLGVSPAEYQAATLPSQILEPCAQRMIASVSATTARQSPAATAEFTGWPVDVVDRWPKELTLVDYLATDDLARTVLLSELMLKLSVASLLTERPQQSEAALTLLQQSRQREHNAKNALVQLRQAEGDLLRMWLLLAPSED